MDEPRGGHGFRLSVALPCLGGWLLPLRWGAGPPLPSLPCGVLCQGHCPGPGFLRRAAPSWSVGPGEPVSTRWCRETTDEPESDPAQALELAEPHWPCLGLASPALQTRGPPETAPPCPSPANGLLHLPSLAPHPGIGSAQASRAQPSPAQIAELPGYLLRCSALTQRHGLSCQLFHLKIYLLPVLRLSAMPRAGSWEQPLGNGWKWPL